MLLQPVSTVPLAGSFAGHISVANCWCWTRWLTWPNRVASAGTPGAATPDSPAAADDSPAPRLAVSAAASASMSMPVPARTSVGSASRAGAALGAAGACCGCGCAEPALLTGGGVAVAPGRQNGSFQISHQEDRVWTSSEGDGGGPRESDMCATAGGVGAAPETVALYCVLGCSAARICCWICCSAACCCGVIAGCCPGCCGRACCWAMAASELGRPLEKRAAAGALCIICMPGQPH